ncbi:MAG: EamA family transporter [Thalassobaculum sp.]|uniref:EamA family transporter n=1 Tax=Thalassobaculum sp. TaxID=2022740 RepID=UPI0032EC4228
MPAPLLSADLLPLAFALAAAVLFAVGDQFQYLGVRSLDSRSGTMISIVTSTLCFWLLAPLLLDPAYLTEIGILVFAVIGLVRPALSANLSVAGVRYLGPTLSSTLASTSPLFGTALGILLLGEVLTWPVALGTAGIVSAILVLSRRQGGVAADWPVWALALPIAAAAIRSLAHVLSKIGMVTVPDAYVAGLVSFTVSALVLASSQAVRRARPPVLASRPAALCFVGSGVAMALAITALNQALLLGKIVVVVPVVSASPVFTMLLSILVFRRERVTGRLVAAVCVVVPSVIVIALGR